jgi:carbon starvation protein
VTNRIDSTPCTVVFRTGGGPSSEDPALPSRRFAPAGIVATKAEKALEREWSTVDADKRPARSGH